jgi:hypothetical protein
MMQEIEGTEDITESIAIVNQEVYNALMTKKKLKEYCSCNLQKAKSLKCIYSKTCAHFYLDQMLKKEEEAGNCKLIILDLEKVTEHTIKPYLNVEYNIFPLSNYEWNFVEGYIMNKWTLMIESKKFKVEKLPIIFQKQDEDKVTVHTLLNN